jgi:tRNA (cmo5U34)-methyltransferase
VAKFRDVPTTTSDPHGHHDWHSPAYVDEWISSDATKDDQRRPLLRQLAAFLPFETDRPLRVLDIGAGYGMLTREVVDRFPAAHVVLHDFSEPMFEHARARLPDALDRLEFVTADLREPTWVSALDGDFDAVVSSIAIHNVRELAIIARIYADIRPLVRAQGCFYNIDFVAPAGPLTARAHSLRRRLPEGEIPNLERHLRWLRDAGFDEADCLLRAESQTLVAGFVA